MALRADTKIAGGADAYRYDEKSDFRGGLNLRADQFNIAHNESPALLNVEVDPRGGVRRRDAVTKVNATALTNEITSLMTHYEAGTNQVLAAALDPATTQSQIFYNADATGNFTGPIQVGVDIVEFNTAQPPRHVTFNNYTASCWLAAGIRRMRGCVGTARTPIRRWRHRIWMARLDTFRAPVTRQRGRSMCGSPTRWRALTHTRTVSGTRR